MDINKNDKSKEKSNGTNHNKNSSKMISSYLPKKVKEEIDIIEE